MSTNLSGREINIINDPDHRDDWAKSTYEGLSDLGEKMQKHHLELRTNLSHELRSYFLQIMIISGTAVVGISAINNNSLRNILVLLGLACLSITLISAAIYSFWKINSQILFIARFFEDSDLSINSIRQKIRNYFETGEKSFLTEASKEMSTLSTEKEEKKKLITDPYMVAILTLFVLGVLLVAFGMLT